MPAKSPLLKKSIHFAFAASISAFWAKAGAISPTTNTDTNAILRITDASQFLHLRCPGLYPLKAAATVGDRIAPYQEVRVLSHLNANGRFGCPSRELSCITVRPAVSH